MLNLSKSFYLYFCLISESRKENLIIKKQGENQFVAFLAKNIVGITKKCWDIAKNWILHFVKIFRVLEFLHFVSLRLFCSFFGNFNPKLVDSFATSGPNHLHTLEALFETPESEVQHSWRNKIQSKKEQFAKLIIPF